MRCAFIGGCDRPTMASDDAGICGRYCRTHYDQWRNRGQDESRLTPIRRRMSRDGLVCDFPGCSRDVKVHPYCAAHDQQKRRGVALTPITRRGGRRKPTDLPEDWSRPTLPKPKPKPKRVGHGSNPASLFAHPIPPITPGQEAAVRNLLARHGHADLLDMLGIAP